MWNSTVSEKKIKFDFLTIVTYSLFLNNSEKSEFWVPFLSKIGSPFYNFWVPSRLWKSATNFLLTSTNSLLTSTDSLLTSTDSLLTFYCRLLILNWLLLTLYWPSTDCKIQSGAFKHSLKQIRTTKPRSVMNISFDDISWYLISYHFQNIV